MKQAIAALLQEETGLDLASMGPSALDLAVKARMRQLAIEREGDYQLLLKDSKQELQELIEELVVRETWFFRDAGAFDALAAVVQREWLPPKEDRHLRILSAPASTGEEPYSIAITLMEAGLPCTFFSIDAVDISVRALNVARQATYGKHSFRGTAASTRPAVFIPHQSKYQVSNRVRECVRFEHGNLLDAEFSKGRCYDIIFCRNVLIYFDIRTQQRVLQKLASLLQPGGYLFVGSSETLVLDPGQFRSLGMPGSFGFVKSAAGGSVAVRLAPAAPVRQVQYAPKKLSVPPPKVTQPRLKPPTAPSPPSDAPGPVEVARSLADKGNLRAAREVCEEHLKSGAASADAYCILGVIADATGDAEHAEVMYRKALYIDPQHVEVLQHLAFLAYARDDHEEARRLQLRARRAAEVLAS